MKSEEGKIVQSLLRQDGRVYREFRVTLARLNAPLVRMEPFALLIWEKSTENK